MRRAAFIACTLAAAAGCGDRLVDGGFYGDATIRLHGLIGTAVGNPSHPLVGAVWLGYSGLVAPAEGIETTALPITSIEFPPNFECDMLDAPPSAGRYAAGGTIIPASIRLARLVLYDDLDDDGRFGLDAEGHLAPPDQLLATSPDAALLFVERPPEDAATLDAAGALLTNWEEATPGYHVVALAPTVAKPALSGEIVSRDTRINFIAPVGGAAF